MKGFCCYLNRNLIVWIIIFFVSSSAGAERVRIVVEGAGYKAFPIAITALQAGSGEQANALAAQMTTVARTGATLVRALELVDPKTYLVPRISLDKVPNLAPWHSVGASGLIGGRIDVAGGMVHAQMVLVDVVSGRILINRKYEGSVAQPSSVVYRFLDDVIESLTGVRGIFSSKIAYVKVIGSGKRAIFYSDIDGSHVERVTPTDQLSLLPAWSADGTSMLFTTFMQQNSDLARLTLRGGSLTWLSTKRGLNTGAAVSPDGKRIALTLSADGNTEIYVMNWDGSDLKRLTQSWGQDVSPTWSHDGKRIAFVSSRSGNPHIYVMDADGGNQRRLTFKGDYNQEPSWSPLPDGQIAFTGRDEKFKYDLFLVDPNSAAITRLTQNQGSNEGPSFSPDGNQIAFTSSRGLQAGRQVYVMDVDGKHPRRVTMAPGDYETPAWGPRLGYER